MKVNAAKTLEKWAFVAGRRAECSIERCLKMRELL